METTTSSFFRPGPVGVLPAPAPTGDATRLPSTSRDERCRITSLRIHRTECSGRSHRYWVSAILDARFRLAGVRIVVCRDAHRQESFRVRLPGEETGGTVFQPVGAAACRALRHSLAAAFAERLALDASNIQERSRNLSGQERRASHQRSSRGERPRILSNHRKETR